MVQIINITTVGDELAIAWSDGKENYIPLEKLRKACPCAICQGEPDAMGRLVKPKVTHGPNAYVLVGFQEVGGYAVQMKWADGHNTGLYAFDLLRAL